MKRWRVHQFSIIAIAVLLIAVLGLPGLAFLHVPRSALHVGAHFIAPLDAIPDDGVPRMFCVYTKDRDAWVRNADRVCGRCYLIRHGEQIRAFLPITSRGTAVSFNEQLNTLEEKCFGVQFELNGSVRRQDHRGFMLPLQSVPITVDTKGIWVNSSESLRPTIRFGSVSH